MDNDATEVLTTIENLYKDRTLSSEQKVKVYDNTAVTYDERVSSKDYTGPRKCAEIAGRYFPDNRENIIILDVGCGTGQCGEEMQKKGFKTIDGLDPSDGMLKEAEKKNIYRNLYCNYFTATPLPLPKDSYDLLTVVGSMNVGFIPYDAVTEMIWLTKPEGVVCIINRKSPFYEIPEYSQTFFPFCDQLENEGKWKKEEITHFSDFLVDADGIVIVYRIK